MIQGNFAACVKTPGGGLAVLLLRAQVNSALDARGVLHLNWRSAMRLFSRLLWIAAFFVATYSWMVAFEHGFVWDKFRSGFTVEWRNLGALLTGKTTSAKPAPETPAPSPQG